MTSAEDELELSMKRLKDTVAQAHQVLQAFGDDGLARSKDVEVAFGNLDHARSDYHEAMRAAGRSVPHQLYGES